MNVEEPIIADPPIYVGGVFSSDVPESHLSKFSDSLPSFTSHSKSVNSIPSQLFGRAYGFVTWFMGLRWYVIVLIVIFGSFIFFQLECAMENRKQKRETKKEGLEDKMKSILRQADRKNRIDVALKRVSFMDPDRVDSNNIGFTGSVRESFNSSLRNWPSVGSVINNILQPLAKIYQWWIVPWVYVIFRSVGIQ